MHTYYLIFLGREENAYLIFFMALDSFVGLKLFNLYLIVFFTPAEYLYSTSYSFKNIQIYEEIFSLLLDCYFNLMIIEHTWSVLLQVNET